MNEIIHTGSTVLNLGLTGSTEGGWKLGRISNIIGDRSTGKTLLAIEAATLFLKNPPKGITPKVIYYEAEAAFDHAYAAALGLPVDEAVTIKGSTVEHLFETLTDAISDSKKGQGTLFIVDSLDAVTSASEMNKDFAKLDFDRKAAKLSELFKKKVRAFEDANLHLMVISQIRENIGAMPFSPKYKRSGGRALDFYCTHILWLYEKKKLKSKSTDLVYGLEILGKITKNKVAKPFRDVTIPIMFDYGIDNIDSMLNYCCNPMIKKEIRIEKATGGFFLYDDQKLRLQDMIQYIENTDGLYPQLVQKCQECWDYVESKTKITRKSKSDLMNTTVKN